MSAFLVSIPTVIERDQTHIDLPDRAINLVQVYPIYEEEIEIINRTHYKEFFMQDDINFSNVVRENTGVLR